MAGLSVTELQTALELCLPKILEKHFQQTRSAAADGCAAAVSQRRKKDAEADAAAAVKASAHLRCHLPGPG